MPVVVVGLSHRTASVAVRERLAFAEATIPPALQRLRGNSLAMQQVRSLIERVARGTYALTPLGAAAMTDEHRATLGVIATPSVALPHDPA